MSELKPEYIAALGTSLIKFNVYQNEAIENLTRTRLFLICWNSFEYAEKPFFTESSNFVTNVMHHSERRNETPHSIVGMLLINEAKRRKGETINGLKLPIFLQDSKHLRVLCQYCHYLLGDDNTIEYKIDANTDLVAKARVQSRNHLNQYLNNLLKLGYPEPSY